MNPNDSTTRTCSRCHQAKPIGAFDVRFLNKGTRLTCATCRGVTDESRKWQIMEERQRRQKEAIARQEADRARQEAEGVQQQNEWYAYMTALGFSQTELENIRHLHYVLWTHDKHWVEIKREFLVLHPPYVNDQLMRHKTIALSLRTCIYDEQDGKCCYCGRALLPLDVHRQTGMTRSARMRLQDAEAGGYDIWWHETDASGVLTGKVRVRRTLLDDSAVPELDHRIPRSRGGTHAPDNLAYACRNCNQRKKDRTNDEFLAMPNDPISRIGINLSMVHLGLTYEARGYGRLTDGGWHPYRDREPHPAG